MRREQRFLLLCDPFISNNIQIQIQENKKQILFYKILNNKR